MFVSDFFDFSIDYLVVKMQHFTSHHYSSRMLLSSSSSSSFRSSFIFQLTWLTLICFCASLSYGQKTRVSNRDLSRTLDTVIGLDLRDGRSPGGTYRPAMRETIVPRSRHTDREHIKISRDDKGRDVETSIGIDPRQDDTVKIEDFLTLGKEERSAMPVSIIDITKENLEVKL